MNTLAYDAHENTYYDQSKPYPQKFYRVVISGRYPTDSSDVPYRVRDFRVSAGSKGEAANVGEGICGKIFKDGIVLEVKHWQRED